MARKKNEEQKEKFHFALDPKIHRELRVFAAEQEAEHRVYPGDVVASLVGLIDPLHRRVESAIASGIIPDNYGPHFFEVAALLLRMDAGEISQNECSLAAS